MPKVYARVRIPGIYGEFDANLLDAAIRGMRDLADLRCAVPHLRAQRGLEPLRIDFNNGFRAVIMPLRPLKEDSTK